MKILLSNDDGVHAEGLACLHAAIAEKKHDVTVIAPDRNCSGASNALSLHQPLRMQQMPTGFYSINGTPSDCVHLGINSFLEDDPQLVVSGINHGPNLGDDVIYSGTVAAATEGRFMGLPAIAVSLADKKGDYFSTAARVTVEIIQHLLEHPLPADQILNINVPNLPYDELKGIKVTRQGRRHRAESMIKTKDPFNRDIYWYGGIGQEQDAGPGTDFHAVANGYCSVTPITVDMTAYQSLDDMKQWIEKL
ncbi:5'/3'-nucleotidase SurE [Alteromonadaceae bacterium M269]|nr:5'/3'-nucleotidase SurE [Alteromonadaceae bacterium M269]